VSQDKMDRKGDSQGGQWFSAPLNIDERDVERSLKGTGCALKLLRSEAGSRSDIRR
jgi:hypothetical protein